LLIAVVVHPADVSDRDGAKLLLDRLSETWNRLRLIWADGGYAGQLIAWVRSLRKRNPVRVEIVKRSDDAKGFKVLPRRWVVERIFGWLGRKRRLSKDYEYLTDTSETMIYVSMIGLVLRRLARGVFGTRSKTETRKGARPSPIPRPWWLSVVARLVSWRSAARPRRNC
jgi:putative transposase